MRRSAGLLLAIASAALITAPAADAASFKRCGTYAGAGLGKAKYSAKGVSCRKAKKILVEAGMTLCFDNTIPGWKKDFTDLRAGGDILTLKKGARRIKTNACSSRR